MWRKRIGKKPQDVNGLQLPTSLTKQNLLIKACQHLLTVIIVIHKYIIYPYLRTKPLFTAAV